MQFKSYKKIGVGMFAAAITLGAVSIAGAQSAAKPNINNVKNFDQSARKEVKIIKATTTAEIKAVREKIKIATKEKLAAQKQAAVFKVISNRIRAHERIINQLSERITRVSVVALKVKAQGKDTTVADKALADAKAKLTESITKLAAIKAVATTTVAAANPQEKLNKAKDQFDAIDANIKIAHKDIATAISSLQGIGVNAKSGDKKATTTPAATTTANTTSTQ